MRSPVIVALSGRGRSLENLLRQDNAAFEIVAVVSSESSALGLEIADAYGLPSYVYKPGRKDAENHLTAWLSQWPKAWVCLAGFLQKWPNLNGFTSRTLNIHPALLPEFGGRGMYGLRVHEAVLASGRRESGATVHFVTDAYDAGSIVSRIRVAVQPGDTPIKLADRVFQAECLLYPQTLNGLISDASSYLAGGVKDYGLFDLRK